MINEITYINSRGDSITFGGDDAGNPWHYGVTDIFDIKQDYEELGGRIISFLGGIRELGLHAVMRKGSLEERDRLVDVLSYDSKLATPGTLYAGESYIKCYAKDVEQTGWHYAEGSLTADIVFVSDDPVWVRKHVITLMADSERRDGGLDYPHDYPFDYGYSSGTSRIIENPYMLPVKCDIAFPGPCADPYVIIGPNRYQVKASIKKGQLIIIQGYPVEGRKRIILRDVDGSERSLLSNGVREEGAHVFAEVPVGRHVAAWSGAYNIEVTMYEERLSPCKNLS